MAKTHSNTIIALIGELIETHMDKCDNAGDEPIAHVLSEVHAHAANIKTIETNELGLKLELDDGTSWYVRVTEAV